MNILDPRPMTPEQVRDLVRRARLNGALAWVRALQNLRLDERHASTRQVKP